LLGVCGTPSGSRLPNDKGHLTALFPLNDWGRQAPKLLGRINFQQNTRTRKTMQLRPLHDRLIVERMEETEHTKGALFIPDSAKEKPQRGTVIAAGNGKRLENGTVAALDVKAGDHILFGKYGGNEVTIDGCDYLILREDEVLAVLDDAKISKKAA
jgi:chaperonin GroES